MAYQTADGGKGNKLGAQYTTEADGVFGCFSEPPGETPYNCLLGTFCPCFLFGRTRVNAGLSTSPVMPALLFLSVPVVTQIVYYVILTIMMGSYSSCLAEPHVCVKSSISGTDGRGAYSWNADGTCDYSTSACRSDLLACQLKAARHINVCVSPVSTLNSISTLISIVGCAWFAFLGGTNRKQMQAKLGEPDGGIMDYVLHGIPCTNPCTFCQEARSVNPTGMAGEAAMPVKAVSDQ